MAAGRHERGRRAPTKKDKRADEVASSREGLSGTSPRATVRAAQACRVHSSGYASVARLIHRSSPDLYLFPLALPHPVSRISLANERPNGGQRTIDGRSATETTDNGCAMEWSRFVPVVQQAASRSLFVIPPACLGERRACTSRAAEAALRVTNARRTGPDVSAPAATHAQDAV
ncbi:hypothetical protein WOLCODRAFT_151777 [Wolfiporia cocos MD-104 SS10]|uniref:Uncharacterized protein n=1 Tax=Wolfiporia cocos (strain MD-104) TaxID=742152 RepID=A0A2H3JSE6_WOLCO|nr:hypothetical protein WOLCODRAFT_151777 [Wolfiporia cocos MD-104 SS10]